MNFHKKCAAMVLPKCAGKGAKSDAAGGSGATVVTAGGQVESMGADALHKRVQAAVDAHEHESLKKFLANRDAVKPLLRTLDSSGCTALQLAVQVLLSLVTRKVDASFSLATLLFKFVLCFVVVVVVMCT